MFHKHIMKILWILLAGGALASCAPPAAPHKETPVIVTPTPVAGIPPIDQAVPARLETATFALG